MGASRWAAWVLRAPMAVALAAHLMGRYGAGARMAAVGLALSLIPEAMRRLSSYRMPAIAELPYVAAVSLEATSKSFNLTKRIPIWDKLVHFTEIGLFSWLLTVTLRGYRDVFNQRLSVRLLVTTATLAGISLGTAWEMVEYSLDRIVKQNLVRSTVGTVLDLLVDSLGALTGALLGSLAYERAATPAERRELGREAGAAMGRSEKAR